MKKMELKIQLPSCVKPRPRVEPKKANVFTPLASDDSGRPIGNIIGGLPNASYPARIVRGTFAAPLILAAVAQAPSGIKLAVLQPSTFASAVAAT